MCPRLTSIFGGELSFFDFSKMVPFPSERMKSFKKYLRLRVFSPTVKTFHTKYKSDEVFIQLSGKKLVFRKPMKFAHCFSLDTRQSDELAHHFDLN